MNLNDVKLKIKKINRFRSVCEWLVAIAICGILIDTPNDFFTIFNPLINYKEIDYAIITIAVGTEILAIIKLWPLLKLRKKLLAT